MTDIILIIAIIGIAALAFNLQTRHEIRIRREERRRARIEAIRDECADARTIDLIGEEAYREMTDRISRVLKKHKEDACLFVNLTCGPDSREGSEELHRLLPGMELSLVPCSQEGLECVDVYHNGARVGRLTLTEADTLYGTMSDNRVMGAYVAEQNCYGIEDSHQMGIIVFYEPKENRSRVLKEMREAARRYAKKGIMAADICQN